MTPTHPLPILSPRPGCTECELHEHIQSVGTPTLYLEDSLAQGPASPALVFVGQNPGVEEDRTGLPFVGASGVMVRGGTLNGTHVPQGLYVDAYDFRSRCSVYVTNAARCHTVGNEPPKARHLKACSQHLRADLRSIFAAHAPTPCFLCLLGGPATASFTQHILRDKHTLKQALSRNAARYTLHPETLAPSPSGFTATLFATYHPAYLMRNPNARGSVIDHLRLLSDAIADNLPAPTRPKFIPLRPPRP